MPISFCMAQSYLPCRPGPDTGGGIGMLGVAEAVEAVEIETITARANAATAARVATLLSMARPPGKMLSGSLVGRTVAVVRTTPCLFGSQRTPVVRA